MLPDKEKLQIKILKKFLFYKPIIYTSLFEWYNKALQLYHKCRKLAFYDTKDHRNKFRCLNLTNMQQDLEKYYSK